MNGKKGRNGGRGRLLSPLGTVIIFLTVAAIITAALLVYGAAERRFAGNRGAIAAVMLTVVIFLSIAGAAIDALRRKITTEGPVGQILDATERIARGDFSVRLTLPRPGDKHNDYGRIMENLNSMAAELAKTEVLRSDFIANVSHEFKTPLAVIQNYAAALRSASGEEDRRQYADVLIGETKKLTALVSNILKLNKLENSGLNPARERIRLDEQLEQCALAFEDKIEEKTCILTATSAARKSIRTPTAWRSCGTTCSPTPSNLPSRAEKFSFPSSGRAEIFSCAYPTRAAGSPKRREGGYSTNSTRATHRMRRKGTDWGLRS